MNIDPTDIQATWRRREIDEAMIVVRLVTQTGIEVVDVRVPNFDPCPDVIVWGERVFVHFANAAWARQLTVDTGKVHAIYREAFAYGCPPGVEVR